MFFNSIEFAIYLPVVFLLYWFVFNRKLQLQNAFIVLASYVFYGWWDWRFLILMAFTTLCSWYSGVLIAKYQQFKVEHDGIKEHSVKARTVSIINIVLNLLVLGIFKYYNFFVDSFVDAFLLFGKEFSIQSLQIILPVGISFYTFQALSYSIDVYKQKIEPTKELVSYFAYVSFFPQLVAGPIERATHLLPQFYKKRTFDYAKAVDGMRQILWGLFKKVVIADNCAEFANLIFDNTSIYTGPTLILGAMFFTFQIYGDFSGYSDIAIGTARLFGINLMQNFNFPYFSRDIAEFWRRWHISLTTWFRDYLYIPLGGSRGSQFKVIRNTFIIFLVSGFWHGANWTFIAWGALNAIYFLPLLINKKNRRNLDVVANGRVLPTLKELFQMIITFGMTVFAWIFFRAESISAAFEYIYKIGQGLLHKWRYVQLFDLVKEQVGYELPILLSFFIIIEWLGRDSQYAIEVFGLKWKKTIRVFIYYIITVAILWYAGPQQQFIYFQF